MEPQFVHFDHVQPFELVEGVTGRPLFGEGAMLNLIELEPGAVVPLHSHEHEQLGIVLRGMQARRPYGATITRPGEPASEAAKASFTCSSG